MSSRRSGASARKDVHFCYRARNDKHDRTIEAFSPAVENGFSSAKFLVDPQVLYAKRRYNTPEVFDSKNLHNRFSIPGLNASHATGKIQVPGMQNVHTGIKFLSCRLCRSKSQYGILQECEISSGA